MEKEPSMFGIEEPTPSLIDIRFDDFAVEPSEVQLLLDSLGELSPSRARRRHVDRGGIETAIWIVLSYVGLKYLDAAFSAVASKHVDWVTAKLSSIFKSEHEDLDFQQAVTVRISADDIDIEINLPGSVDHEFYEGLISKIVSALKSDSFSNLSVDAVRAPVIDVGGEWQETFFSTSAEFDSRYVGIDLGGYGLIDRVYDLVEQRFVD
jgi:hypothetical protein